MKERKQASKQAKEKKKKGTEMKRNEKKREKAKKAKNYYYKKKKKRKEKKRKFFVAAFHSGIQKWPTLPPPCPNQPRKTIRLPVFRLIRVQIGNAKQPFIYHPRNSAR